MIRRLIDRLHHAFGRAIDRLAGVDPDASRRLTDRFAADLAISQPRILDAEDHGPEPTADEQAIIDSLRATDLPEVTDAMRDRAVARFEREFPPATPAELAAKDTAFRRAYLDALTPGQPYDGVDLEAAAYQPRRRWPDLPHDAGHSRPQWQPPEPSDYQPAHPPSAPLPPGAAPGPGFARYTNPQES